MKRLPAVLLAALLATPALAQGITITRPGTPPPATTAVPALTDVPAGWRVVSGRIRAPREVRLPAGSTVTVSLEDVTRLNAPATTVLKVDFPATRLSTPYQLQFNSIRLNAHRVYTVVARVYDRQGHLLYTSTRRQQLPGGRNVVMDLRVSPAR